MSAINHLGNICVVLTSIYLEWRKFTQNLYLFFLLSILCKQNQLIITQYSHEISSNRFRRSVLQNTHFLQFRKWCNRNSQLLDKTECFIYFHFFISKMPYELHCELFRESQPANGIWFWKKFLLDILDLEWCSFRWTRSSVATWNWMEIHWKHFCLIIHPHLCSTTTILDKRCITGKRWRARWPIKRVEETSHFISFSIVVVW